MPSKPIPPPQPARPQMAHTHAACSPNDDGSRPPAATHERPSGRGRPTRIDPSTITSPTTRSRTQISPGRPADQPQTNTPNPATTPHHPRQGGPASDKHHGRREAPAGFRAVETIEGGPRAA